MTSATPRDLRSFGLTVGAALLAAGALAYRRGHSALAVVAAALGGALVLAALAMPRQLGPVRRAWMRLALAISRVTTPLLMAVIYFGVLTPLALLMRLVGRRPLGRRRGASVWVERPPGARRSDLRRQF